MSFWDQKLFLWLIYGCIFEALSGVRGGFGLIHTQGENLFIRLVISFMRKQYLKRGCDQRSNCLIRYLVIKKRGGFTSAYKIQLFNLSKFWSACRTYISSICLINHNSTLLLFSFLLFSIVVIDLMTVISVVSFNWYDSIGSDPPNRCHALPYLIMNQGIKVKCYSFKKANPVYGKLNLSRLFI